MLDAKGLFALHQLEGIGWKSIDKLNRRVSNVSELVDMEVSELMAAGLQQRRAETIKSIAADWLEERLAAYRQAGIGWLTVADPEYPALLKETSQPPWVLYYKGDVSMLRKPLIAMVGTRTPTVYGKKTAFELSRALSQAGFGVVSGLARGIDSEAHRGALCGPGGTVAVAGTSLDIVYPPENASLFALIAADGLALSEYPLGMKPHPGLFPLRNRVIAGLSLGTVVVEAARRSGSLITADQALEESRDVFAVPGPISSPKSEGTLALLKQGAKLVSSAADIMEEYEHLIELPKASALAASDEVEAAVSVDERLILSFLSDEPVSVDALLEQSKFEFGHLHSVLLSLLMTKKIEQVPGFAYIIL